jgi:hypothetical protein
MSETPPVLITFIVRAARDARGRLHGIVERVKTGEKERFTGADGLGGVIEKMLVVDAPPGAGRVQQ